MNRLLNRLILFLFCALTFITFNPGQFSPIIVLVVIIFASVDVYMESPRISLTIFTVSVVIGLFVPAVTCFLPLFAYGLFSGPFRWVVLVSLFPFFTSIPHDPGTVAAFPAVMILSLYLAISTETSEKRLSDITKLRDQNAEKQIQLEKANRELLERQDFEVQTATLNERNRIARELHDNVGHVLTSALLQTGAMIATCKDDHLREPLRSLQKSLSDGMDEVRLSIHDLHEDSEDLYTQVRALIKDFQFCPVKLFYNIDTSPDRQIRNAFYSIIKECLSNIARHSDASEAIISLREHPALFQLSIRDNGNTPEGEADDVDKSRGMGLIGIEKRVELLKGNVVFRRRGGFEVFISIPKERV